MKQTKADVDSLYIWYDGKRDISYDGRTCAMNGEDGKVEDISTVRTKDTDTAALCTVHYELTYTTVQRPL